MGELELGVYSDDLMEFELDDVLAVLDRIGGTLCQQYESVIPGSNKIVDEIKQRQSNRATRIRPEQLRPEARKAIADVQEYKRLEAIGDLEPFSIKELLDSNPKLLGMESHKPALPRVVPEMAEACPHCGFEPSPQSSATLFRLSDYYRKRAENASEKESSVT